MRVEFKFKVEKRDSLPLKTKDNKPPFSEKLAKANEILAKIELPILKRK